VVQLEIGPLAGERVREHVRDDRQTLFHHLGPLALAPQRTEGESTNDRASHDERKSQVRRGSVLFEECAVTCCFRRQLTRVREREDLARQNFANAVRQHVFWDDWRHRLAPLDDPVVRLLKISAVGRQLKERAPIDAEELDQRSKGARDFGVDVRRRGADEPRGDIGHQPLERALIGARLKVRHECLRDLPQSTSRLIGKLPTVWDGAIVQGDSTHAAQTGQIV
jgi:hypothetical protein